MNSGQFRRWLAKQGCTFEPGKGGHLVVRRGSKKTGLPRHGGRQQLPNWLMKAIKRDLGLLP